MASCKAETGSKEVCYSTDSVVICRGPGPCTQTTGNLMPGVDYPAGTPVKFEASDSLTLVLLTDPADEIAGVVMWDQDLTAAAATDVCPATILCDAVFDVNMVKWPESFTVAQLEVIVAHSVKPCFRTRLGCIELPQWVADINEGNE